MVLLLCKSILFGSLNTFSKCRKCKVLYMHCVTSCKMLPKQMGTFMLRTALKSQVLPTTDSYPLKCQQSIISIFKRVFWKKFHYLNYSFCFSHNFWVEIKK